MVMRRLRRCDPSPVWLVLYSLCVVCVFSFVFFEMLDVDGSEFDATNFKTPTPTVPMPTVPMWSGLRHSTTQEVLRVLLQHRAAITRLTATIDPHSLAATPVSVVPSRPAQVAVVVGHTYRITLPRASLETAPPA